MKLVEYINHLQGLLEQEGDIECWYSSDDEGNYYQPVNYQPSLMVYIEGEDDLHHIDDYDEIMEDENDARKVICVN